MPIRTKLPKTAPLFQKLTYPIIRNAFYFFFAYLPYGPVRRENVPELSGPMLIAGSHSNFLCDPVINGFETPAPPRFLGKHTLFRFPIKSFITFCGAIPVYRPQDAGGLSSDGRSSQNKSSFRAAIRALQDQWSVCIYPEGGSYVTPGLNLPLKSGVAKLALTAEEASNFNLGLRIIPVGLEYGSRPKVGSGLIIRYGKPLVVADYKKLFEENYSEAVTKIMDDLTEQLKKIFPHFESNEELLLAKRLVAMGAAPNRMVVSRLFRKYREKHPELLEDLVRRLREFEEESKEQGIPVAAWGYRSKMLGKTWGRRILSAVILIVGFPFFILDIINNTFSEYMIRSVMGFFASDETEMMTIRFIASFGILPVVFAGQFWVVTHYFAPNMLNLFTYPCAFALYFTFCSSIWVVMPRWRKRFKTWASQLFYIGKHKHVIEDLERKLAQFSALVREEDVPSNS